jgi:cobaltochelatase CobS
MSEDKEKITCLLDGGKTHLIKAYLRDNHPGVSVEDYRKLYPDAPLISPYAQAIIDQKSAEKAAATITEIMTETPASERSHGPVKRFFHEVFEFGSAKAALNSRGEPIPVDVFEGIEGETADYLQPVDPNYVFPIEETKDVLTAFLIGMPCYIWGWHGTGKTTLLKQVAARTKRPFLRIQHTVNTEESQIVGQYVYRDHETRWQPGPLQDAMRLGLVYCADEYDRAMANVLSVYQAVLEGEPLIVKEAPPEYRITKPHPNFRFAATGNTNGCGDETGLYQGTIMQDAANYSRFGLTVELGYMDKNVEIQVIAGQAKIQKLDATKLRLFAEEVRNAFTNGKIGATISPRELIQAGLLGRVRGGDWRGGLRRAWGNRLSRVDREVVDQFAQRIFGGA